MRLTLSQRRACDSALSMRVGLAIASRPAIASLADRIARHPAFAVHPSRQPDARV